MTPWRVRTADGAQIGLAEGATRHHAASAVGDAIRGVPALTRVDIAIAPTTSRESDLKKKRPGSAGALA